MANPRGILAVVCLTLGLLSGCIVKTGSDLGTAVSNEELIQLSREMRAVGDAHNTVAAEDKRYAKRLTRLTKRFQKDGGPAYNFKVYLAPDSKINATADGSIRIHSALMDMMTDNELLFLICHELGHLAHGDILDATRTAYRSSSLMTPLTGAAPTPTGRDAQLSELLYSVLHTQFSPQQEAAADAYGYALMRSYSLDTKAALSALHKLGNGPSGLLPTHPGAAERIKGIQALLAADTQ